MLKTQFKDQMELDIYLAEQKERKIKGYLTRSEREQLDKIIKSPKEYIVPEKVSKPSLVTNINELRKPCLKVEEKEDVRGVIEKLKDTLSKVGGLGITANQIGINKRISYIRIPKFTDKEKRIQYNEYILINTELVSKSNPVKVTNEGCLSFPGVEVTTQRYIFITARYENEKREMQTGIFSDLEGFAVQHETDHQDGITIFDRKWRAR
jgi:peptide deformylase